MTYTQDLQETLQDKHNLIFYKIMHYPIPKQWEIFVAEEKTSVNTKNNEDFSRIERNTHMDEYLKYIKKFTRLYKSLPFIKKIYLCNSITFNALKEDSDIDLFIVTKRGALRRARFFSAVMFFIFWIKRSLTNKKRKFCLSFYVTEDAQNLYSISLPQVDIYLSYWLAHLVPLYQENKETDNIYKYNNRVKEILPNLPEKQNITIGIQTTHGISKFKKWTEIICGGVFSQVFESIIKVIWLPILLYKTNHDKKNRANIIINNTMLKFHNDIRQKIHLLYKTSKK